MQTANCCLPAGGGRNRKLQRVDSAARSQVAAPPRLRHALLRLAGALLLVLAVPVILQRRMRLAIDGIDSCWSGVRRFCKVQTVT